MRVSLFVTCLVDQLFPDVGVSTVRLLRRLGCEVEFPSSQTCCGQPAWNCGYDSDAKSVALSLLDAFESSEVVVSPSGSCVGMVRHGYNELFGDDPVNLARARALAAKTFEVSQFIVGELGVRDVGARFPHRVTYHPSCHGTRMCGVGEEPLELLRNVEGLELVPLERAEDCCGFGGAFSVKLGGISGAMAEEKCEHALATGADWLVSSDAGCLMNLDGTLRRGKRPLRTAHLVQVLARETDGDA